MSGSIWTAAELADLRAFVESTFPDTCRIQRWSQDASTSGGWGETWEPDDDTVACRVEPSGLQATEQPIAGRVGVVQFYAVHVPHTTTLTYRDRIEWVTGGVTLQVVGEGDGTELAERVVQAVETP